MRLVMETISQLHRKFTRNVVVSSGEGIIDARQEQLIRDIERSELQGKIFPNIFTDREIERGVVRHVVGPIPAKEP